MPAKPGLRHDGFLGITLGLRSVLLLIISACSGVNVSLLGGANALLLGGAKASLLGGANASLMGSASLSLLGGANATLLRGPKFGGCDQNKNLGSMVGWF